MTTPLEHNEARKAYMRQAEALKGVRVTSVLVGPHPDDPGPGYSRRCMVCNQREGHGTWVTCASCERRLSAERPLPWWVAFTPLRWTQWARERWF